MANLDSATIDSIETRADDILRDVYGDLANVHLPVNVAKVAKKYGINVFVSNFTDGSISGIYDKSRKQIHVSKDEYLPRQLFTMGHELGHFFLHSRKTEEVFYRKDALTLGEKPKTETEADWFASALLMPSVLVRSYWEITKDVEKLAEIFGVSESAMRWRLHNLGLKNHATGSR